MMLPRSRHSRTDLAVRFRILNEACPVSKQAAERNA